jgi:hypothetical protein
MPRFRSTVLFTATALAALSACSKQEAPPPPPPAETTPPPAPPLGVVGVDLGKSIGADRKVAQSTDTFGVRDTIYASVATTGAAPSAVLTARWTFQSGQVVDSTSQTITPSGPAVTEFHISKKSAWPVGKYKVAILLDGQPATEKEFEIKR